MSELLSVALVCAGTLLARDCSRDTALDVIIAPARTPMECMMHGQSMAASTWVDGGEARYLKITCERRRTDLPVLRRAGHAAAVVRVPRDAL